MHMDIIVRAAVFLTLIEWQAANQALAGSYFLKGSLTYQVNAVDAVGNSEARPLLSRTFEVFVNDCNWKVRTRLDGNSDFDYFQNSFDGTNLYYTFKLVKGARLRVPVSSTMTKANDDLLQPVIVETGTVPRGITSDGAEYIWLAFASGCYFKHLTNNTVIDFDVLESRERGATITSRRQVGCRYVLSSVAPYLPSEAEYAAFDYASHGRASETTNDMILGARFTSEAFTNFNGFFLPTKFEYSRYVSAPRAQDPARLRIGLTVQGIVSFLSTGEPEWGSDIPEKKVIVSDVRVPGVPEPGVMYITSNSILPSPDDTNLIALRKQALVKPTTEEKTSPPSPGKRKVFLGIFGLILVAPLIIFVLTRTIRKTRKCNKQTKKGN
jgi:hypothetical protein